MNPTVLARAALLAVIFPVSYVCLYYGLTLPIATISSTMGGGGEGLRITRSTLESIEHFFKEGFYLPAILLLVFSVIVPLIKLCTIIAVLICMRVSQPLASRWSFHLRQIAKFQFLDVFVALLMVAFLNQEVISTNLESGFSLYLGFCLLSVLTAQLLYSLAHNPDLSALGHALGNRIRHSDSAVPLLPAPPGASSEIVTLGFRALAGLSLVVGLLGSLYFPVLSVKVAFEGSLVVSQSVFSLSAIFWTLVNSEAGIVTYFLAACVIFAPLILLFPGPDLTADWAMADVCALAVFTTLVSLNSFGVLVADAPGGRLSGFYFLLMAGLACLDLCGQSHARAVNREADALLAVAQGPGAAGGSLGGVRFECEEAAWARLVLAAAARTKRPGILREAAKRMTGGVVTLKLVGWGVFFTVWAVRAADQVTDLSMVNSQIRQHLPAITDALRRGLPESMGNCGAGAPQPCQGRESLYYQRTALYELEARWVQGLKSTSLSDIYLSVPSKNYMAVAVDGEFASLPLSLYIAECSTPDVWITGRCRAIWDNLDACCGSNKKFNVMILSQCYPEYPFVRNITVHSIRVDPMHVQEKVMGLVTVSLTDLTDTVQEKLKQELGPYLNERKFIPWGGENISLGDLINKILLLNAGENFSCPKPIMGFFKKLDE